MPLAVSEEAAHALAHISCDYRVDCTVEELEMPSVDVIVTNVDVLRFDDVDGDERASECGAGCERAVNLERRSPCAPTLFVELLQNPAVLWCTAAVKEDGDVLLAVDGAE